MNKKIYLIVKAVLLLVSALYFYMFFAPEAYVHLNFKIVAETILLTAIIAFLNSEWKPDTTDLQRVLPVAALYAGAFLSSFYGFTSINTLAIGNVNSAVGVIVSDCFQYISLAVAFSIIIRLITTALYR